MRETATEHRPGPIEQFGPRKFNQLPWRMKPGFLRDTIASSSLETAGGSHGTAMSGIFHPLVDLLAVHTGTKALDRSPREVVRK